MNNILKALTKNHIYYLDDSSYNEEPDLNLKYINEYRILANFVTNKINKKFKFKQDNQPYMINYFGFDQDTKNWFVCLLTYTDTEYCLNLNSIANEHLSIN